MHLAHPELVTIAAPTSIGRRRRNERGRDGDRQGNKHATSRHDAHSEGLVADADNVLMPYTRQVDSLAGFLTM